MQRGLATLEIIFAIIIIGVLVKVAVPNAAQILDIAALDYETKKLYSELRFVQEMGRSSRIDDKGMGGTNLLSSANGVIGSDKISLIINYKEKSYQVSRTDKDDRIIATLREPHYLSNSMKEISSPKNPIYFDSDGKANIVSNHITLTSRLGKKRYIIFNSVGRMRSSLTANE